jgi:hypothetical protein
MAVADDSSGQTPLERLPQFDLAYLFEDSEHPNAVTIYQPDEIQTAWITADRDVALDIEDVR